MGATLRRDAVGGGSASLGHGDRRSLSFDSPAIALNPISYVIIRRSIKRPIMRKGALLSELLPSQARLAFGASLKSLPCSCSYSWPEGYQS